MLQIKERRVLIVAIDYASNREGNGLSPASEANLKDACEFALQYLYNDDVRCVVASGVADFPKQGMLPQQSLRWKKEICSRMLPEGVTVFHPSVSSSIEEAERIRDECGKVGFVPDKIVIFCDTWHKMRLEPIWRHFFPESTVLTFKPSPYMMGSDYRQILLRNQWTWGLANCAGWLLMAVFGVEAARQFKQP